MAKREDGLAAPEGLKLREGIVVAPKDESMKDRKKPVEVAVYDRAFLEHHEVQPVSTQDGHTITVDSMGRFGAILGDVTVDKATLEEAKEKVHTTHLAQEIKRKKKAMAVPCVVHDPRSDYREKGQRWMGLAFFRGVHAGNGAIQYAHLDGTKAHGEGVIVWGREDAGLVDRLLELDRRMTEAQAIVDEAAAELKELRDEQGMKMYEGTLTGREYGFGRHTVRPKIGNNAAKAQEVAEAIVANVLTKPDKS